MKAISWNVIPFSRRCFHLLPINLLTLNDFPDAVQGFNEEAQYRVSFQDHSLHRDLFQILPSLESSVQAYTFLCFIVLCIFYQTHYCSFPNIMQGGITTFPYI